MAENYILVAGTGETASFQNHLVRYLLSADGFSAEPVLSDGRDSETICEAWRALWSEGKLPQGKGQPKDYAYKVQPLGKHKDKPRLDFAFLPLALAGEETAVPQELDSLAANPGLNFVLVLVCGRDAEAGQDEALARLVAGLRQRYGEDFASRCPALLLASAAEGGNSEAVEAFAGERLPATIGALQDWPGRYTLGELDMGEFERTGDGELFLGSPKFEDTARIFRWIYFQFTRYPVTAPFLTRLWKSVRKFPY